MSVNNRWLDRISEPREEPFVFTVRANPEPNYDAAFHDTQSPPIEIDSDRVDRQVVVDLLEPQRRMGWVGGP